MTSESTSPVPIEDILEEASSEIASQKNRRKRPQVSGVWDHYKKVGGNKCVCGYCGRSFLCDSKKHGTKTLWNHLYRCPKYILSDKQAEKDDKQTVLSFGPKRTESGTASNLVGIGFDKEAIRKVVVEMIVVDELPFKFVENKGFRRLMRVACPKFECPSRIAIAREIFSLFLGEKENLKKYFKASKVRVSLTTDIWTSIQNLNYMVITAHFIDDNWRLHKRILSFSQIVNHKGETIGKQIESCLLEWGLEKIFTITVDNASANEVAINYVKKKVHGWQNNRLILNGDYMHVRCLAHVVNLIVGEGLKNLHKSIASIRNAVRYVRSSPARLQRFQSCVEHEKIQYKGNLVMDVPTRWNATYLMLESALHFQKALDRLEEEDGHYKLYFAEEKKLGPPTEEDWDQVRLFVSFLHNFYEVTLKFSAFLIVTSHIAFNGIWRIHSQLIELQEQSSSVLCDMAKNMKKKFDKYFGSFYRFNEMLLITVVLDPIFKIRYFDFTWRSFWGDTKTEKMIMGLKILLVKLYETYKHLVDSSSKVVRTEVSQLLVGHIPTSTLSDEVQLVKPWVDPAVKFMDNLTRSKTSNEVDTYLNNANLVGQTEDFDILAWWKLNEGNFPVLSRIAKDVLAILVSTVASESAFSTGGRILDQFRSSLTLKMVESLICSQNWLTSTLIDEVFPTTETEEDAIGDYVGFCTLIETEVFKSTITAADRMELN